MVSDSPAAPRAARSRRRGFSLLELTIALSILVVGLGMTVYGQITAANLTRTLREHNTAMADLETCMEQILLVPMVDIPDPAGPFAAGQPVAAFNGLSLPAQQIVPTYPGMGGGGPVPDPLEIVLTATWNDWRGRPQVLRLSSMKTR